MHILKIKKPTATWIVGISQYKEDITEYLETLSDNIQTDAFIFEIPFEYYPFIIIENTKLAHNSDSYFEYCDFENLQKRIAIAKEQRLDSAEHIYFKYYYINEPYAQMVSDENEMKYLRHTTVTNQELDEPYEITFFHEEIKKNVSNYDIDRLDQLFEHTKTKFNSAQEKEDLALNGYDSLFWEMNYDHACGKLTDEGIGYLIPMVENMEVLLDEKKWQHRSFAQHILLEQACQKRPKSAGSILQETIEAFDNYLISHPEEKPEIHRLLSLAYRWMMKAEPTNATTYWQLAVSEITKAIDHNPEEASWSSLFELMYMQLHQDGKLSEEQIELQKTIQTKTEALENQFGVAIAYPIALGYQQLKDYLEWNNIDNRFPDSDALHWAEKSLRYHPENVSRIDLHESAEFFNKIGWQTNRIAFLEKTISIYERIGKSIDDGALEVYYIANILKQIAEIHANNGEQQLADQSIKQAQRMYEKNITLIKSNKSSFIHYAEFLEFCYAYEGNIIKPTVQELKQIAIEVEIQSEGFISYPYLLLMRMALLENNEKQAILELIKSLILHELCADSTFDTLFEEFKSSSFNELKAFINETQSFIKEVNTDYYYDPKIKWEQLSTMSEDELRTYWENRKEEIRNRPPFKTE